MAIVAQPETGTTAPTILVIDDDADVQRFAAKALAHAGYRVLLAADVQDALHVAAAYPSKIDLALIDVMLPSGNGIELATALLTKHRDTLVLYMSGFPADAIQSVQHDGGPDGGFLEKPFSAQALVQRIKEILPVRPQQDQPLPSALPVLPVAARPPSTADNADAVYRLETPVSCPQCRETITTLKAVRLLRTQVNFTSTLPRRGRVLVCPGCLCVVSAELTNF
jgi:DNA-binding response OmpR family regulator